MNSYVEEIVRHRRALIAASLGLIGGTSANFINNVFSPRLIGEFGWSKADLSLIGMTIVIGAICMPIAGRIADRVGTRPMALTGVVTLPLIFIALSMMNGSFWLYFALMLAQMLVVTSLNGIIIYNRLVAGRFTLARGLAFAIVSSAPAVAAVGGVPLLSAFVDAYGWRAGYVAVALVSALLGGIAVSMIAPGERTRKTDDGPASHHALRPIVASRAFLLIFGAMLLCNLHFTVLTSQLQVVAGEHGIGTSDSAFLISIYAIGAIIGRFMCGVALDRFAPPLVGAITFMLPALGLAMLATATASPLLVSVAILCLGLSVGGEGDLLAYAVARYFRAEVFSTVLGMFTGAMAVSALAGALILNRMLGIDGTYAPFLAVVAVAMFLGSLSFLFLEPRAGLGRKRMVATPLP